MAKAWSLASRPKQGLPTMDNFKLIEMPQQELQEGQYRARNTWLSVDPYHRARMNDISYAPSFVLGEPMYGGAVGEVIESRHPDYAVGDKVFHSEGWREESIVDPENGAREGVAPFKLPDEDGVPEEAWLNQLGIPGGTGWFGLMRTGQAKAGDIVLVSGAAGATGSAVVQVAKAKGMKVIGIAGGAEKCEWLKEIGADATVDYKAGNVLENLQKAAPDGVDVYFDNVGSSELMDDFLMVANPFARVVICGMISVYNDAKPRIELFNFRRMILCRVRMEGMTYFDNTPDLPEFHKDMIGLMKSGKITNRATAVEGIEGMPEAFLGLFSGRNIGKMLIKL